MPRREHGSDIIRQSNMNLSHAERTEYDDARLRQRRLKKTPITHCIAGEACAIIPTIVASRACTIYNTVVLKTLANPHRVRCLLYFIFAIIVPAVAAIKAVTPNATGTNPNRTKRTRDGRRVFVRPLSAQPMLTVSDVLPGSLEFFGNAVFLSFAFRALIRNFGERDVSLPQSVCRGGTPFDYNLSSHFEERRRCRVF